MTKDREPFIETFTGGKFYFRGPQFSDIRIDDIAHALSNLCRFAGHCRTFYSVAQHSVLVSAMVPPELALHALLHDAAEAYMGDLVNPLKYLLGWETEIWSDMERGIDAAIAAEFGLRPLEPGERDAIKAADLCALATERRDLMVNTGRLWPILDGVVPHTTKIEAAPAWSAKAAFLVRFQGLCAERAS